MKCAECEGLFDAYLDGELTGSLRLEFDAHRLRCRRCQQTLAMMETVSQVIASDPQPPALSYDFTERVIETVQKGRPLSVRLRSTRVAVVAGVMLQAAAVLIFAIMMRGEDPATPTGPPTNPTLVDGAMSAPEGFPDMDLADLDSYIRDRVDLVRTTRANWVADFGHLARSPVNINVDDDVARSLKRFADTSPWKLFLEAISPPATTPAQAEPAPSASDVYPL